MASTVASEPSRNERTGATNRRGYWSDQISKAQKRYSHFHRSGADVQDRYRLQKADSETDLSTDRYNILYSTTETTKPSLYAQTPKVQATKRHRDRENDTVTLATLLLETAGQYALEEIDFDGVLKNAVQDYLLPGMGNAWVRYAPVFGTRKDGDKDVEEVSAEGLDLDYVHFKDVLFGVGRVWKELPWISRRVYFNKSMATKRFGAEKANMLAYTYRPNGEARGDGQEGNQAVIHEIWDKVNRRVMWYSDDYADDLLDIKDDPLKLKNFWPCPEPMRAVWTTSTFIPKAFYSQYKAQAKELDNLTQRIRYLTKALRVAGVYDGSQTQLAQLLDGEANKMVAVDNWAMFAQQGGIAGSLVFLPIKEIADVLMNLLQQRDVVKNEIYEITGFSDIVRGVSKASETLGAQKLKSDWAGGRLKDMQKEVQRFCRDLIRIMSEIMSEHFSDATLAEYAGFDPPEVTPEEQAAQGQYASQMVQYKASLTMPVAPGTPQPQPPAPPPPTARQQAMDTFKAVVKLLRNEKTRCAQIGIETDSTIMPDEAAEREDRMAFLGAAGAFLQQAGPMAMQFPEMRGLLGGMLMFTIRTFRASRPLEKVFEDFQKKLEAAPPQAPPGEGGGDGGKAAAEASIQTETIKQQGAQALAAVDDATARYKIDQEAAIKREQMQAENAYQMAVLQADTAREQREHDLKMRELALREREVAVKEAELGIEQATAEHDAALAEQDQAHSHEMDEQGLDQQDREFDAGRDDADRSFEHQEKALAKKPT